MKIKLFEEFKKDKTKGELAKELGVRVKKEDEFAFKNKDGKYVGYSNEAGDFILDTLEEADFYDEDEIDEWLIEFKKKFGEDIHVEKISKKVIDKIISKR